MITWKSPHDPRREGTVGRIEARERETQTWSASTKQHMLLPPGNTDIRHPMTRHVFLIFLSFVPSDFHSRSFLSHSLCDARREKDAIRARNGFFSFWRAWNDLRGRSVEGEKIEESGNAAPDMRRKEREDSATDTVCRFSFFSFILHPSCLFSLLALFSLTSLFTLFPYYFIDERSKREEEPERRISWIDLLHQVIFSRWIGMKGSSLQ